VTGFSGYDTGYMILCVILSAPADPLSWIKILQVAGDNCIDNLEDPYGMTIKINIFTVPLRESDV